MNDTSKLIAAIIAAGSIGGFGGHTIGSGDITESSISNCSEFIKHAQSHEKLICENEKLKLSINCN